MKYFILLVFLIFSCATESDGVVKDTLKSNSGVTKDTLKKCPNQTKLIINNYTNNINVLDIHMISQAIIACQTKPQYVSKGNICLKVFEKVSQYNYRAFCGKP